MIHGLGGFDELYSVTGAKLSNIFNKLEINIKDIGKQIIVNELKEFIRLNNEYLPRKVCLGDNKNIVFNLKKFNFFKKLVHGFKQLLIFGENKTKV